jgi:tape measure domain-containing protein
LSVASSFEQMEVKLNALTRGRGRQVLEEINAWAKEMPVNTQQAVDTFAMMQAMGLDPTIEKMQTLVDVSVLFGEYAMPRVARALGQMQTLGRLSAEELNQMSEAGINARKYLTEAFGKTVEEIQKAQIPIEKVVDVIWQGLDAEFGGAAQKARSSWRGMMVEMHSIFIETARRIMDSGVFDFLKAGAKEVLDLFGSIKEEDLANFYEKTADTIVDSFGLLVKGIALVGDSWRGWKLTWFGLKTSYANFISTIHRGLAATYELLDKVTGRLEGEELGERLAEIFGEEFDPPPVDEFDAIENSIKKGAEQLREAEAYWKSIAESAGAALRETALEEWYLDRVSNLLEKIKDRAAEYRREREKITANYKIHKADQEKAISRDVTPSRLSMLKEEAKQFKLTAELEERALAISYERKQITLQEYFHQRTLLAAESFKKEMAYLKALAAAEKKPGKRLQIQTQIIASEKEYHATLLNLSDERRRADELAEENYLERMRQLTELRIRALAAGSTERGLASAFSQEILEMDQRHAEELQRIKQFEEDKFLIKETYRVQDLEKERLLLDQKKRLREANLSSASQIFGSFGEAFSNMYELSGKESKKFFKWYKTMQIAQTLIDTYGAAQKAYYSMVGIPYVGPALGVAAAAAAVAAGLTRVALIRKQKAFAKGGLIPGSSPSDKADNVPIWATAGEYVHPVDAVRHYGLNAMTAIKNKMVPRELLSRFSFPYKKYAFAAGGPVGMADESQFNLMSGATGGININISAVDAASFRDLANRNPAVIIDIINSALENNDPVRRTMKEAVK